MSLHKRCSKDARLDDGRPNPNHCPTSPHCDHVWHYYFAIDGQRYRGSTQTADKTEAQETERRARAEALARIAPPERALPEHVKSVNPTTTVDPLRESSAEVWARWSRESAMRDAVERRKIAVANREMATKAIYPRECAERLAEDLKQVAPDWRHARPTLGPEWGRLLQQQPEMAPELTKRREAIITTLFNHTPPEFHRAIQDLRTLIDYMLIAHEAAAYTVGFESGRKRDQTHVDSRDRTRTRQATISAGLRLTLGE
jgi:hypothetical protein